MGRNHFISIARSILLILLLVTTGCATTSSLSGDFNPDDPYEKSNRKVFEFNNKIDKFMIHILIILTKLKVFLNQVNLILLDKDKIIIKVFNNQIVKW